MSDAKVAITRFEQIIMPADEHDPYLLGVRHTSHGAEVNSR